MDINQSLVRSCPRCKGTEIELTGRELDQPAQILSDEEKYRFFQEVRCRQCEHIFAVPVD